MPIGGGLCWQSYNKETPTVDDSYTLTANRLWEKKMSPEIHQTICGIWQSEYLTCSCSFQVTIFGFLDYIFVTISSVNIAPNERFLKNGKDPYLTVISSSHVLHVFVNGKLVGNEKTTLFATLTIWFILTNYIFLVCASPNFYVSFNFG